MKNRDVKFYEKLRRGKKLLLTCRFLLENCSFLNEKPSKLKHLNNLRKKKSNEILLVMASESKAEVIP